MAVVNMTRGLYLHTDGRYWKEVDISEVKTGDIISICTAHNMNSGWPDLQKSNNYQYKAKITEYLLSIVKDNIVLVDVDKGDFPKKFLLYKLIDFIPYNHNQEPEDDCL